MGNMGPPPGGPPLSLWAEWDTTAGDLARQVAKKSMAAHLILPISARGHRYGLDERLAKPGEDPPSVVMQCGRLLGGMRPSRQEDTWTWGTSQMEDSWTRGSEAGGSGTGMRQGAGGQHEGSNQTDRTETAASQDTTMGGTQDTSTTGLSQHMAHCSMYAEPGPPPGMGRPEDTDISRMGWQDWTEETIQANFEFLQAMRAQEGGGDSSYSHPGLHDIGQAFASWTTFKGLLRCLAYEPEARCPWRALGMDPATAATATIDLLDDRTARLRLLIDEAEHQMGHREADSQNVQEVRAQVSEWHERCRVEMPEVQALTRRRGIATLAPTWSPHKDWRPLSDTSSEGN